MARIYFIRHTAVADPTICYGRADVALKDGFEADWEALLLNLSDQKLIPKHIFTSPAGRCRDLAHFLCGNLEPKPGLIEDERLLEINFGAWEGRPWTEVPRRELDDWAAALLDYRFPAGENVRELLERCKQFLAELAAGPRVDTFVVTHAGVIRSLLTLIDGLPVENLLNYKVEYGSITSRAWPRDNTK